MRIAIPQLKLGKRKGYRCIYSRRVVDETEHVVFLEAYFKGDKADLVPSDYLVIARIAKEIFENPLGHEWDDFDPLL
ncbi:MAG: hypothetical protein V3W41_15595 [Planctomycetota bacterium]